MPNDSFNLNRILTDCPIDRTLRPLVIIEIECPPGIPFSFRISDDGRRLIIGVGGEPALEDARKLFEAILNGLEKFCDPETQTSKK